MISLGASVKDKITGFSGVVTGRAEYLTGCTQCLVVPKIGDDGIFKDSVWFDEQRLDLTKSELFRLNNSRTPGPDKPAPKNQ